MKKSLWRKCFGLVFLLMLAAAVPAHAVGFSFEDIKTPPTPGSIAAHLSLNVTDFGGGKVDFTVSNASGGHAGIVTGITIQDLDGVLTLFAFVPGSGVSFVSGGGANLPTSLGVTETFAFQRSSKGGGGVNNGINPGEFLTIRFTGSFASTIAGLDSGKIRVGMHVQSLVPDNPGSQKVINRRPTSVPDAGNAAALLGISLVALTFLRPRLPIA